MEISSSSYIFLPDRRKCSGEYADILPFLQHSGHDPDRPAAFLQNPYGMFYHNPAAGKYDNGSQLPAPGNYIWKTDIPAGHRCCKTVSDPVPAGPTAPGCGVPDGRKSGFSGYLQRADLS